MKPEDLSALVASLQEKLTTIPRGSTIGIIGLTPTTLALLERIEAMGCRDLVSGVYAPGGGISFPSAPLKPLGTLLEDGPTIVLVASDEGKEQLLSEAIPFLSAKTLILIGGFGHFAFSDPVFLEKVRTSLVPSLANGYPNSLIHIYQCLRNAARLGVEGIVVEFGMFKGGTTMLMSRFIEEMGVAWKIYGFDSFFGFPPPRSALDMYAHPDCVYLDEAMIRRLFDGRNVEIVAGDIVETIGLIRGKPIVLAFVDTDNFTPASAVLDVIQEQVVPGGAIVFDHFTGRTRFLYTLGERIAAKRLLGDARYFNLHDTGVFLRQK